MGFDSLDYLAYDPTLIQQLGITAAQAEQLRALLREAARLRIQHRADMALKRMELEELLAVETPDRALMEKKLAEISVLQQALLKSRMDSRLALQNVLTSAQHAKLRTLLGQRVFWRGRGLGPCGLGLGPGPMSWRSMGWGRRGWRARRLGPWGGPHRAKRAHESTEEPGLNCSRA